MKRNNLLATGSLVLFGLFASNKSIGQGCVHYNHLDAVDSANNRITFVVNKGDTMIVDLKTNENQTPNASFHTTHGFYKHETVIHYNGEDYLYTKDVDDEDDYKVDRLVHVRIKPKGFLAAL